MSGQFSNFDRPLASPEAYLCLNQLPEFVTEQSSLIEDSSFLKFAEYTGEFESAVSQPCDMFETIILQTSSGTISRDDLKGHHSGYREISIHGGDCNWTWTSDQKVSFSHFYLSHDLLDEIHQLEFDGSPDVDPLQPVTGVNDPTLAMFLEMVSKQFKNPQNLSVLETDAWSMLLGKRLLRSAPNFQKSKGQKSLGDLSNNEIQIATEWIEFHLNEDISVQRLAGVLGLNPYQFSKKFQTTMGVTPYQYILERRISAARRLLENGSLSIAQIANEAGFNSQSHMTDTFKRRLGVTPGAYRSSRTF